jgi:hypothetical protein
MQPTNAASARFVFFLHFNQKGHFISTRADIGSKCVLFRSWDKFLSNSGGVSQFIILLNHFLLADFATGRAYKEDKYTGRRIISFRARPACLPAAEEEGISKFPLWHREPMKMRKHGSFDFLVPIFYTDSEQGLTFNAPD